MAIEFRCSKCNKKLKVKDELAGKKIKCPSCQEAIVVSNSDVKLPKKASKKDEAPNPDLNSTELIINLNLDKYKGKAIDPDDEDVNLDELQGAVVRRKKQEEAATAKPPAVPMEPIDWLMGLLCFPVALVFSIVLIARGGRSRGVKVLILSLVMLSFYITVVVLSIMAGALAIFNLQR